jgi:uncharacterized membrane protein
VTKAKYDHVDHPLERLMFFSDAVFAIAITLLIIEIKVPHLPRGTSNLEWGGALAQLIPNFVAFLISFFVIGRFWMTHHTAFGFARHFDKRLNWPNLHLLAMIAFMPFATALVAEHFGELVPTLFYNLTLIVTAILSSRLIRIATSEGIVKVDADSAELEFARVRGFSLIIAAIVALLIGLLAPLFSQVGLATIPLWLRLLQRRKKAQPDAR